MFEKFIEENLERDVKNFLQESDLYTRYLAFCEFYKFKPLTKTQLGNQLNNLNAGRRHRRMRNYMQEIGRQGVKLSPCKY